MKSKIEDELKTLYSHLKEQSFHIFFFAVTFMLCGTLIPDVYYKYFDKTEYYKVVDIQLLETVYPACGTVSYLVKRTSLIDISLNVDSNLLKIEENGQMVKVFIFPTIVSGAGKGDNWIQATRKLPCDLEEGNYLLQFFYSYNYNDVEKVFRKDTKPFLVQKQIHIQNP